MKTIKLLNAISPVVEEYLPAERYAVGTDVENPDAILVRSADMNGMDLNSNLLAVARAGAGYNNIPVEQCSQKGIVVFNTPGANANAVREMVVCGMLLSGRKVVESIEWAKTLKGKGAEVPKLVEKGKGQFVGRELKGKCLGVIGVGAIGVLVANAAVAMDMKVLGYDTHMTVKSAWGLSRSVERAGSVNEIFQNCDYVTLHVPLNDDTKAMIGKDQLAMMKPDATILNFSRAELVDAPAVLEALREGKLHNYVVDFPTDEVIGQPGVIAIPHLGASTPESEDNCAVMAANELQDYLENGNIANSVNFPACEMPRVSAHRVTIIHQNITNMVGQITTAVAEYKINIDNMINKSRGNLAYTMLDLDEEPEEGLLRKIAEIEGALRVRKV